MLDRDWMDPRNATMWQGVNGTNNPCPPGFRLPTKTELETEWLSWRTNNSAAAFASPLKLVVGGERDHSDGSLDRVGFQGHIWSSTDGVIGFWFLDFDGDFADVWSNSGSADGKSVRCIQD